MKIPSILRSTKMQFPSTKSRNTEVKISPISQNTKVKIPLSKKTEYWNEHSRNKKPEYWDENFPHDK